MTPGQQTDRAAPGPAAHAPHSARCKCVPVGRRAVRKGTVVVGICEQGSNRLTSHTASRRRQPARTRGPVAERPPAWRRGLGGACAHRQARGSAWTSVNPVLPPSLGLLVGERGVMMDSRPSRALGQEIHKNRCFPLCPAAATLTRRERGCCGLGAQGGGAVSVLRRASAASVPRAVRGPWAGAPPKRRRKQGCGLAVPDLRSS